MKIHKPIGSKDRFLEMFQGVNKINLNENALDGVNPIEAAFNELVADNLNIEQVNNQVSGGESIVEIAGRDKNGNDVVFKFAVQSQETDQDNVNQIQDVKMISAKIGDNVYEADDGALGAINANRKQDMFDAVSELVEFESDVDTVSDEMYEDAVKFIDKVPYNKGTEQIQTSQAYGDEKPTNPELRVKAPELNQFVSEIQDYIPDETPEEDPLALPDMGDIALPDDGTTGVDPYDQQPDYSGEPVEQVSPEKEAAINQAYDNLVQAGNPSPTSDDISREANRLQGVQPPPKTRTIPRGAEEFYESTDQDNYGNADDVAYNAFNFTLSPEKKREFILNAEQIALEKYGPEIGRSPMSYFKVILEIANELYTKQLATMNEDEETYPKQLGKKFKPKRQIPKKKKKPQSVVKLSEEDNESWKDVDGTMMGPNAPKPEDMAQSMEDFQAQVDPNLDPNAPEELKNSGEEPGNVLQGGLGDDKEVGQFCPIQVAKGVEVEMEHTDNPLIAVEIVMDHLTEDPMYYGESDEDPEAASMAGAQNDVEKQEDEELTDELLGYKSLNVGDGVNEKNKSEHPLADVLDSDGTEADLSQTRTGEKGRNLAEEEGFTEYMGDVGDRYRDANDNEFTVRNKVKGGVTLQGQAGEKEVATSDLLFLKKT